MRKPIVLVSIALVLAGGVAAASNLLADRDGSYPGLRQAAVQELPGTLGFVLAPPSEDLEPRVAPGVARREGTYGEEAYRSAVVSLAHVEDRFGGTSVEAWVVFTQGICISNFKGELVQASRHPNRQGICDERNLWFEMIDATTGARVMRTRGYDPSATFQLIRGV